LNYRGIGTSRHCDEITIIQHDQTVYKGCLKRGGMSLFLNKKEIKFVNKDQLTFKSQRYRNNSRIQLEIYVNGIFEDELVSCCEHSLIDRNQEHFFQVERVFGSKPCQQ